MGDQPLNVEFRPRANIALVIAAGLTAVWVFLEIQWVHGLNWDEIEFFRATRWLSEGRLPYRDFWEHHAPLQWFVFAPLARFLDGAGAASVIALRWAQLPLWVAGLALLFRFGRQTGGDKWSSFGAIVLLISSRSFTRWAIEYRVDTLGSVLFLAAVAMAISARKDAARWSGAGALFALAVLSNVRLAPVVIATAVLLLIVDAGEQSWRFRPAALWMAPGAVAVAVAFLLYAAVSGTFQSMIDGLVRYNVVSDRMMKGSASTLGYVLSQPFRDLDLGTFALLLLGVLGGASIVRGWRKPDVGFLALLIVVITIAAVANLGVQYGYHLQLTLLFLTVLAARGLGSLTAWRADAARVRLPGMLTAAVALLSDTAAIYAEIADGSPALLRYENIVMLEADRHTSPGDKVWDGCGFALRREPSYRYWFLPAGIRALAQGGMIPRYGVRELLSDPPAAIIMNLRTLYWVQAFPELIDPIVHLYVPVYRNLWLPGMSARFEKAGTRAQWRTIRGGEYRVYASDVLAKHPWYRAPLQYTLMSDERLAVPLTRLPALPVQAISCRINGAPVDWRKPMLLRKGDGVEITSAANVPIGVLVVSSRFDELFTTPGEDFIF